jgi:hypothetical protein
LECGFTGWPGALRFPAFRIPKPFLIEFITASSETEIHSKAVEAAKAKRAEAGVPLTEAQVREMNASIY